MKPSYIKGPKTVIAIGIIWIPIVFFAASLFYSFTGASLLTTFWIVTPIMYSKLFFVLSTWYICKILPADPKNLANIILRHLVSSLSMIGIWLLISYGYTTVLDYFYPQFSFNSYFKNSVYLLSGTGFVLYFLGILFHYFVQTQEKAQETLQRLSQSELSARESQLRALHTSINPHFLFNSLTALSTLTVKNPQQAQKMCLQLSEFLRYNLRYEQKQFTTIGEEMENIENYLAIEQIRLGDHLIIDMNVDISTYAVKTIPFLLLPLIENAVKHGIQESINGGTLHFQIQPHEEYLWICVHNPAEMDKSVQGIGLGLKILQKRLAAEYDNQFKLKIENVDNMFIVDLKIPKKWRKR